jgi:hypothetical protein
MKLLNARQILFSILGSVLFGGVLWGQVADRATITGLVADPSGAAVPDARVTLIQESTKVKTVVGSSGDGNYASPPLILGAYTVQVEKAGFKTHVRSGIMLTGGMRYRQDVTLELGALTQVVEVKAVSSMITTENADVSHTVDNKYYQDLPNVMGADIRLAEARLTLQPGFMPTEANGDAIFRGSQFRARANGGQQYGTENFFDGASFGYAEGHNQTQESSLPYGAVREMTMVANNFSAQYGHTSGAFIQYTTKSGSDTFHGDVFDYFTSGHLQSRNFFLPNVIPLTQNNYGVNLGGPIRRGKTFFFTSLDLLTFRSTVNTGYFNTLPLMAERQGNFTRILDTNTVLGNDALGRPIYLGEIYNPATLRQVGGVNIRDGYGFDPVTGLPIAGQANIIPANDPLRSAVAAKIIPYIPTDFARDTIFTPNQFGGSSDDNNKIDVKTWLIRVDHSFSDKFKLSNTFFMNERPRVAHCGDIGHCTSGVTADPQLKSADNTYFGQGFWQRVANRFDHLQLDYIIKPNLYNHTTLAYDRWYMGGHSLSSGHQWFSVLGLTGLAPTGKTPQAAISGPPNLSFGGGRVGGYTAMGQAWIDGYETNNRYQLLDDITWIMGKHTVKAGFEYRHQTYPQVGWATAVGGAYAFSNNETAGFNSAGNILSTTGDPFASFLLGQVDNGNYNNFAGFMPIQNYEAFFAQDEFKVTSKLTLTMGVRFDYEGPLHEQHERMSTWDPTAPNPGVGFNNIPGAMRYQKPGEGPFEDPGWNVGPRFGFAYSVNPNNVVRGGYAMYYGGIPGTLQGGYPVLGTTMSNPSVPQITGGLNPAFYWDGPTTTTCTAALAVGLSVSGNGCGFPQTVADFSAIPSTRGDLLNSPYVPGGIAARGDAANTSTMPRWQGWNIALDHLFSNNMAINIAYVGNRGTRLPNSPTYLGPGNNMNDPKVLALGTTVLTGRSDAAFAAAGIANPFPNVFHTPAGAPYNITVAQALRPFPQVQAINWRNAVSGMSNYHSLQATFDRRLTAGFQLRAAYTFSKLINNGAESASGSSNESAMTSQSGIQNPIDYQKGERSLSYDDVPHYLAFGWVWELPFGQGKKFGSGVSGAANIIIGGWKLSGQQSYNAGRPLSITMNNDMSGLLFNSAKRPNKVGEGDAGVNKSFQDPATDRYLVKSGWADPGSLKFGNAARTDPRTRGFAFYNEDVNFYKDTKVNERVGVRFEAQGGNIFNRVVFCPPNKNWSAGGFGTVTSQCNNPRRFQFGLSVTF